MPLQVTAELVKRDYPTPVPAALHSPSDPIGYCVGGALCRFLGGDHADGWPIGITLAGAIRRARAKNGLPKLVPEREELLAEQVMEANDEGQLEHAWALLDRAITTEAP